MGKVIETARLILRTWKASDAEDYYRINQDPLVIEFVRGPLTLEEVRDFLEFCNKQFEEKGYTVWAAEQKSSGKLMGFIGLHLDTWEASFTPAVEVAWRLGSQYWGKGYATEGAKAALEYGFHHCGLKEIVSFTVPANSRSVRVMEKIGMIRDRKGDFVHPEFPLNHPLAPHILYRIKPLVIDKALTKRLVASQFPQWKDLPIRQVASSGWDNRTFHLGNDKSVRMPSAESYALQVEKEHRWLPVIASQLPLEIPKPLAMGKPEFEYPWHWSVYHWLEGNVPQNPSEEELCSIAASLATFLVALQSIDAKEGPAPGPHNFYRGGPLATYDAETRAAIKVLTDKVDPIVTEIWEKALSSQWVNEPVWLHGDMNVGNLLVKEGKLCAVIDFGQLGVGDPACDLAIAWTLFKGKSREIFRSKLALDPNTWTRARGWALWKAVIMVSGHMGLNTIEVQEPWKVINEIIAEYKNL